MRAGAAWPVRDGHHLGYAGLIGAVGTLPLTSWSSIEISFPVILGATEQNTDVNVSEPAMLAPEAQIQIWISRKQIQPYVGIGIGGVTPIEIGAFYFRLTGHLGAGLRTELEQNTTLQLDLRHRRVVHAVFPVPDRTTDLTITIGRFR